MPIPKRQYFDYSGLKDYKLNSQMRPTTSDMTEKEFVMNFLESKSGTIMTSGISPAEYIDKVLSKSEEE